MDDKWEQRIINVSDKIFPGLCFKDKYLGHEILTNLPLQISLYFNVILFPFWLIAFIHTIHEKFNCLSTIYQVVIVSLLGIVTVIEVFRLFLGYSGNLNENIPDLAGFWLLTILIQIPLQLFLLINPKFHLSIIEITLQVIMVLFLLLHLVFGYFALKKTAKYQFEKFQLEQQLQQKNN